MALKAASAPRAVQCESVGVKYGPLGARRFHRRTEVDRADAIGGEFVEQQVVFGPPAGVLRPVGEIVGIDRGGVGWHSDEKPDPASLERGVHSREQGGRVRHPMVAQNQPGALLDRFLA